MIDLKRFHRLNQKGLCQVTETQVLFKRFDNETGEELSPEYQYYTVEELEKVKKDFAEQIEAIEIICKLRL
jgi:hypothetical protein